jgi:hypothetical protein
MILPQELRIGNWVRFSEDGEPAFVCEIDPDGVRVRFNDLTIIWVEINEFEGNAITPEILEKADFELSQDGFYYFGDDATFRIHDNMMLIDMAYTDPKDDSVFYMNIGDVQYIHQLQNLFHALTNEELVITL